MMPIPAHRGVSCISRCSVAAGRNRGIKEGRQVTLRVGNARCARTRLAHPPDRVSRYWPMEGPISSLL